MPSALSIKPLDFKCAIAVKPILSPLLYFSNNSLSLNQDTPVIVSVSPSTGTDAGGDTVTITGSNFGTNPQVLFGTNLANITSSSSTSITVTTPPSSIDGKVEVFVVANGLSSQKAFDSNNNEIDVFTYNSPTTSIETATISSVTAQSLDSTNGLYTAQITWNTSTDSTKKYNAFNLSISAGSNTPLNVTHISDTSSNPHTYTTTNGIGKIGDNGSATITPLYIDSAGKVTTGTPSSPFTFSFATNNNLAGPTNIQYTTSQNSNGTFNVTFTFTPGANSIGTFLFMDGLSGTSYLSGGNKIINPSTSNGYWPGTSISVPNLSSTSSHSFYFYAYDGISTANDVAAAQNPIVVTFTGNSTSDPVAPVSIATPAWSGVGYTGSYLTGNLTLELQFGTGSDGVFVFLDGPPYDNTTRINSGSNNYWSTTTVTLTQIPHVNHTIRVYSSSAGTLMTSTSYPNGHYIDIPVSVTGAPVTTPTVPTPVLSSWSAPYVIGGGVYCLVAQQSGVVGYYVYVNGNAANPTYQSIGSSMFEANSTYLLEGNVITAAGQTYTITAVAVDANGNRSATSNAITVTVPAQLINANIDSNDNITWTVPSNNIFTSYSVNISGSGSGTVTANYTVRQSGSSWVDISDGTVLSTNGINFSDNRINSGGYKYYFPQGAINVFILGNIPGQASSQSNIATGIVTSANGGAAPVVSAIYPTVSGSTTTFTWYDPYFYGSSFTITGYQVDLYSGTSPISTNNIQINGGSGYTSVSGDSNSYFFRAVNSNGTYTINTSHSHPLYIRVRPVYYTGSISSYTLASNWTSVVAY